MPTFRSTVKIIAHRVPGVAKLVRQRDELRELLLAARTEREQVEAALAASTERERAAREEREKLEAMLAQSTARLAREDEARILPDRSATEPRDVATRRDEAVSDLQSRLEPVPATFAPADPLIGGLRFSRPGQIATVLDIDLLARRAPEHEQVLLANVRNPGPLATFLRGYLALNDAGAGPEALRFALVVELVLQLAGDSWVDLGSFGHDAAYIGALRPDLRTRLYSYQGGHVGIYPDGYWYVDERRPEPLASAYIEPLDFESDPLPIERGTVSLVTAFEVFEHFKFGPQQCMLEINRVLKSGGRLVLTVPNAASAAAVWKLLHGEHPSLCSLYHRQPGLGRIHPSEYVASQLRELVEAFGFRVDALTGYSTCDYSSHERRAIGWCHSGNFRGASEGDDDFGASLLLVATKVGDVHNASYPPSLFERA